MRKLRDLKAVGAGGRGSLEQMMSQLSQAGKKEFPLIIKGDVQGSVEAIASALEKLGTDEVAARHHSRGGGRHYRIRCVAGIGVECGDRRLQRPRQHPGEGTGRTLRHRDPLLRVIYDLVDDIKAAMSGLLAPTLRETFLGNAEILEVFNITKVGNIAGCRVTEGKVERGANVRLIRDNVVIHEGKLSTLSASRMR